MYPPAAGGLRTHRGLDEPTLAAETHGIRTGGTMIGKFWAYMALIVGEGRRAYDGRRTPLDKPAATREWLTLEQCRDAERVRRGTRG
jgi:hypothetical protein